MKIMSANPKDCDEIIRLQRLAYEPEAQLYQDWKIPPLTQTAAALQREFAEYIILKAVNAGEIIGSVRAQLVNDVCHIGRLIVHPDFQGKGIGTELLKHIEKLFSQTGRYELFTGSKSEGNIRFYLRNNYEISQTQALNETISLVYLTKLNKTY